MLALAAHRDLVVSAGADGTLSLFRLCDERKLQPLDGARPDGAPVFAALCTDDGLYVGCADRAVRWAAWADVLSPRRGLRALTRACDGHTGWVRALAAHRKGSLLLSVGCNFACAWALPSLAPRGRARLFTGDILALATAGEHLYSGGADGSLHRFAIKTGDASSHALAEDGARADAHAGRVEVRRALCTTHDALTD